MTKHKHHDVIIAYLNEQRVEIWSDFKACWLDVTPFAGMPYIPMSFSPDEKYRIKPQEEMSKLRIERDTSGIHMTHISYTDCQDVNLRLFWVDNKLVRAEVV